MRCCHQGDVTLLCIGFLLHFLVRTIEAAAAVTVATCGTVLLLLIAAHVSSSAATTSSSNLPFALCNRALELLRDVDAKSMMPLHVHAQVMVLNFEPQRKVYKCNYNAFCSK